MKDKTNILDGAVSYLAGPIDRAADDGIEWRMRIRRMLQEQDVRLAVLDPTHKFPGLTGEVGSEKRSQQQMKRAKDWAGIRKFMKKIVRADLRMIDLCDFVIAMVDIDIHMCGTYHEIILADFEHKPVLLIIKGGKERCPSWLFGIIHHNYMFDSVEECVKYLVKVDTGDVELDDKWVLMREGMRKLEFDALK